MGDRLELKEAMGYEFTVDGRPIAVDIQGHGERLQVDAGNGRKDVEVRRISENTLSLSLAGRLYRASVAAAEKKYYVHVGGRHFCLEAGVRSGSGGYARDGGAGPADGSVSAPMPGTVVSILVKEGDEVQKNQGLVIVESMKMENTLRAQMQGRVAKIRVKEGDLVDTGVSLVELDPMENRN
jgi:biotin carboxyl carrier protein